MQGRVGSQQGRQGRAQQHRDVQQDTSSMEQQAQEGPVVVEAHAVAQQAAVVVPTKDTDPAGRAMPTSWWHLALTLVAVTAGKETQGQSPSSSECLSQPKPILGKQAQSLPSLSLRFFIGKPRLNTSQALPVPTLQT